MSSSPPAPPDGGTASASAVFFQTASGCRVDVSAAAMARAKRAWQEVGSTQEEQPVEKRARIAQSSGSSSSAAAGKMILVSERAVEVANATWQDKEQEGEGGGVSQDFSLPSPTAAAGEDGDGDGDGDGGEASTPASGFATASGKRVLISEKALQEARRKWSQAQEEEEGGEGDEAHKKGDKIAGASGDCAGSGGKEKKVVHMEQEKNYKVEKKDDEDDVRLQPRPKAPFSTGSGKRVSISREALLKAKQLWREMEEDGGGQDEETEEQEDGKENAVKSPNEAGDPLPSSPTLGTPPPLKAIPAPPLSASSSCRGRVVGLSRLSMSAGRIGRIGTTPKASASLASPILERGAAMRTR